RGWIGFTAASSAAVTIVAPSGAAIRLIRPDATELLTNRTQRAAGRSPVNRPRPATSVGSSRRPIERPTQPPSFLASPAIRSRASLKLFAGGAEYANGPCEDHQPPSSNKSFVPCSAGRHRSPQTCEDTGWIRIGNRLDLGGRQSRRSQQRQRLHVGRRERIISAQHDVIKSGKLDQKPQRLGRMDDAVVEHL